MRTQGWLRGALLSVPPIVVLALVAVAPVTAQGGGESGPCGNNPNPTDDCTTVTAPAPPPTFWEDFMDKPITTYPLPPVSPNDLGTIGDVVNPGPDASAFEVAVAAVVAAGILTSAYCATVKNIATGMSNTLIGWLLTKVRLAVPAGLTITANTLAAACGKLGL